MAKSFFILLILSFTGLKTYAGDTTEVDTSSAYVHIPKRSAFFSLFPAAGQVYNEYGYRKFDKKNRAWWKVPIIYGALGTTSYFWYKNHTSSQLLKKEILYRRENGDSTYFHASMKDYSSENALISGYTDTNGNTVSGYDAIARRRDLLMFATIGIYGLQILEAYVDGHFVSFDVSDDLSMSWYPKMLAPRTPGVGLTLSFK